MEKTRGWWMQRVLTAVTKFAEADDAVQDARAMVAEHGWCSKHGDVKHEEECRHCDETRDLLADKIKAMRGRAGKKATLLRVAKRAGISARVTVPRVKGPLARRATIEHEG